MQRAKLGLVHRKHRDVLLTLRGGGLSKLLLILQLLMLLLVESLPSIAADAAIVIIRELFCCDGVADRAHM